MKIPQDKFYDLDLQSTIKPWIAHSLVQKRFCGPMNVHGLCTEVCDNCAFLIMGAFDFNVPPANPIALLIWRLKDAVATAKETKQSEKPKREYEGNPFAAFL